MNKFNGPGWKVKVTPSLMVSLGVQDCIIVCVPGSKPHSLGCCNVMLFAPSDGAMNTRAMMFFPEQLQKPGLRYLYHLDVNHSHQVTR